MTGSDAIDILARRLRDSGSTAHSRDLIATVLSHCLRALNLHQRAQRATASLAIDGGRVLFRVDEDIAEDVGRIERVIVEERSLPEVHWSRLIDEDPNWLRTVGERPQAWARFGRTALAVVPAPWAPVTATISYLVVPPDVTDDATEMLWPEELVPMLLDLTEGVMLFKGRLFAPMDGALGRFVSALPLKPGSGPAWREVNS